MRKYVYIVLFIGSSIVAGCAATQSVGDWLFTPTNGTSRAEQGAGIARGVLPPPWGELLGYGVITLQNGYLGTRRLQKRRAEKRAKNGGTSKEKIKD